MGQAAHRGGLEHVSQHHIEKQQALGLDAVDMNIILHLTNYWWTADKLPFPSVETIAQRRLQAPRRAAADHGAAKVGLLTRAERRKTR